MNAKVMLFLIIGNKIILFYFYGRNKDVKILFVAVFFISLQR